MSYPMSERVRGYPWCKPPPADQGKVIEGLLEEIDKLKAAVRDGDRGALRPYEGPADL